MDENKVDITGLEIMEETLPVVTSLRSLTTDIKAEFSDCADNEEEVGDNE